MIEWISLFFPFSCPLCGEIQWPWKKKQESLKTICSSCRERYPFIEEPICKKCGKPVRDERKEFCYDCTVHSHYFEEGRSLWLHKPPVSNAIYAFKYHDLRIYGQAFGRLMGIQFAEYLKKQEIDLLVPIPLSSQRRRERGYNQAAILAGMISKVTGIPCDADTLVRQKNTRRQKNLGNKARQKNVKGAFRVCRPVAGMKIAVIDDIYTTGSTIDEAALVLRRSNAQKVIFLTISIGQGY